MKAEGSTSAVLHKVKVKEESKECSGFQQTSSTCANMPIPKDAGGNSVSTTIGAEANTTTVTLAVTSIVPTAAIISHQSTPTTASDNNETRPVDLDLKCNKKGNPSSSKEKVTSEESTQESRLSPNNRHLTRQHHANDKAASRSLDNDSPLPPSKIENGEADEILPADKNGVSNCVSSIVAGHAKLKRLLGTLVQFATDISPDTGDTVRSLVLALLSASMTAEEFHIALQEATNFPLREFVLPYLKHALPSLQKDLKSSARANNQTCMQYLRSNESVILEAVGLVSSGESAELFAENISNGNASGTGANSCTTHHTMRSNSISNVGAISHGNNSNLHYYPGTSHAQKRRASEALYYENGIMSDDGPMYSKRSNTWTHPLQHQTPGDSPYCWYHPLHSSGGSVQNHTHALGHVANSVLPNLVQIKQLASFSGPPPAQHQQQVTHGGSNLDDEWKNIHVMLSCILGMVEKTKRALAILQRRGCSSPATAPQSTPNVISTQNGNGGGNPSSTNGSQVESSTGDRDGGLKRLSGEIVAQTIRATEDRVAEVKRKAEEAVQEVKRAAVAEVQRAVAVAVAESRASERFRNHRYVDLPLPHRNHANVRQSSFARVSSHPGDVSASSRNVATPTTTCEDEKDGHLTNIVGSSCWNCGRPALETCGGCGIARYCGSFCQLRDWETGGHHANCNNVSSQDRRGRSSSRSPPRIVATSASDNDVKSTVALKGK